MTDGLTFAEINARRKRRTRSVWVVLDPELLSEVERLQREVRASELADRRISELTVSDLTVELRADLAAAQESAQSAAVEFVFTELARSAYRALMDEHKHQNPTKMRYNPVTFMPALVAATNISPGMTEADAQLAWAEWGEAAFNELFGAASAAQEDPSQIPFIVPNSAQTAASAPSSTTAPPEE